MVTRIFVSYSHQDSKYLQTDSLLGHLQGLRKDGVKFWYDHAINAGENWDDKIKTEIGNANIALALVSQMFLNSKYCTNVEVEGFLHRNREEGLIVFPVILSPCDWPRHEWLKSRQFLPGGDKTIEEHYRTPGQRKRIFHTIMESLREHIKGLNKGNRQARKSQAIAAASKAVNTVNKMLPEVKSFHNNRPEDYRAYGLIFEGREKKIVAIQGGFPNKTITAADLDNLPPRQLKHINIFQDLLDDSYSQWEKLYRQRRKESNPTKIKKLNQKIRGIVADMQESLDRIFSFLGSAGLHLDDHYLEFRHVIKQESQKAEGVGIIPGK